MRDVAADLGVSVITVSKVLRNQGRISTAVRKRVLERAKELNYRPNLTARSLATGRTFLIGMIVPDLMHPFFAAIAKVLARNLRQKGYSLVLSSSDEDPELELQEIEALLARNVDTLVLASSQLAKSNSISRCLREACVPHLLLDRPLRGLNSHFVGSDNEAIGELATEHLIERGYRRIAHIGIPSLPPGRGRLAGYKATMRRRGRVIHSHFVISVESGDERGEECGYAAMHKLLALKSRPDAVFCYNDVIAAGAQRAVLEAGLAIPGEIALIGVSNLSGLSGWNTLQVPLSTIDQDVPGLAAEATQQILELQDANTKAVPRRTFIPLKLVVRDST
ncbi:MAG: LacI family DNA-binding transcriptional regulator [Terracidiphilus sp.]